MSLRYYREQGMLCAVVEHYNTFARIRQDLFGIIDVLCVGDTTVAVQCTSYSNMASRVKKIQDSDALPYLRKAGWTVVVQGWHKKNNRWVVRTVEVE